MLEWWNDESPSRFISKLTITEKAKEMAYDLDIEESHVDQTWIRKLLKPF